MLEETDEQKETRLKKRREASQWRTAEAKGKEKEYIRVYRQQKEAAENAEERATRLAKPRQVWGERSGETNGNTLASKEKTKTET